MVGVGAAAVARSAAASCHRLLAKVGTACLWKCGGWGGASSLACHTATTCLFGTFGSTEPVMEETKGRVTVHVKHREE